LLDTYYVEAKNEDEAREMVLSGDLTADKTDSQYDTDDVEELDDKDFPGQVSGKSR
jgi:hypothetical protein